eukprot:2015904-Pyramimonas_sp.AAC.1
MDFSLGFLYFGNDLFAPGVGMTQGSNISPGLCNAVCCYLERKQRLLPATLSLPHVQHVHSVMLRWTDDIF